MSQEKITDRNTHYLELMRLQRRVGDVLELQVADGADAVKAADETRAREVDKLVRVDADPVVFEAIAAAAWEAPGGEAFAGFAKETMARIRLQELTGDYGSPAAFLKKIQDSDTSLKKRESEQAELEADIARLRRQLEPVEKHNQRRDIFGKHEIRPENRKTIEAAGLFAFMESDSLAASASICKRYAKANARYADGNWIYANIFDDIEKLAQQERALQALGAEVVHARDQHFKAVAGYRDVHEMSKILREAGKPLDAPADIPGFQKALIERLGDEKFINAFARNTPAGTGGPVILAALGARIRHQIQDRLSKFNDNVREMTTQIEGPIGILARDSGMSRPMDGIAADVTTQALMAGYLCESAAAAFKALDNFTPDHLEGPVSLNREMQMHLIVNGKVDPAFLHDVGRIDTLLARHFNVNTVRPDPDFATVLAAPVATERVNKRYADFLRANANNADLADAGFAAGQFSADSIELFLVNRYFSAGSTRSDMLAVLREEAAKVEAAEARRASTHNAPELPQP